MSLRGTLCLVWRLVCHSFGGSVQLASRVEARDAAGQCAAHRAAPQPRTALPQMPGGLRLRNRGLGFQQSLPNLTTVCSGRRSGLLLLMGFHHSREGEGRGGGGRSWGQATSCVLSASSPVQVKVHSMSREESQPGNSKTLSSSNIRRF